MNANTHFIKQHLRIRKINMKIVKMCEDYLKSNLSKFILFLGLSFGLNIINLISPYIAGNFIDGLVANTTIHFVYRFCLIMVGITFANMMLGFCINIVYVKISTKMSYHFNRDVLARFQNLPLSYLINKDIVAVNQIINGDTNELISFCIDIFNNLILKTIILIALVVICCNLNLEITLILMSFCMLYVLAYILLKKVVHRNNYLLKNEQSIFFSKLYEQLQNLYFIKANGIQKKYLNKLDSAFGKLYKISISNQKVNYIFNGLDGFISMGAQIVLYILGALQIMKNEFTIGQFTIYIAYFNSIYSTIKYYFNFSQTYQAVLVSYKRIEKFLQEPVEATGEIILTQVDVIEIRNMSFKFNDSNRYLYQNISIRFLKNKIYGIVGRNGVGKTTFINIIIGLYNNLLQDNVVLFNDIDIKNLNVETLRRCCIGISLQQPFLVNDTVKANISLLTNENELDTYSYNTLVEDFELSKVLEYEYDDRNEQSNNYLSGGEKQKIEIARCLLKTASVFILDEPTASLDSHSTTMVFEYLDRIKTDKIVFVITHDEKVVARCDEIVNL